jgi:photosystem I subunit 3
MTRPSRLLGAALLLCAAAAAVSAAVGFVGGAQPSVGLQTPWSRQGGVQSALNASPAERNTQVSAAADEPAEADGLAALLKWVTAGLLAGALLAVSSSPANALDDRPPDSIFGDGFTIKKWKTLEICKNNKKYQKKAKDRMYKLDQKQKQYTPGTGIYNFFFKKKELLQARIDAYGGRYCGKKDGIPRTVATGELVRGGVVVPGLLFLYTAGWIGWAGRSYLQRTGDPEKEIYIDVPLALTCMGSGFAWPVNAWKEIVDGKMAVPNDQIWK